MKNYFLSFLFILFSGLSFSQQVTIELFKSGFSEPLSLQHANDERLFVVEKGGKIKIIQPNGTINTIPFLDISSQISTDGEQGLLGLAFHPNYSDNGFFYVNYTDINGDTRISRFMVDTSNPDITDMNSELVLLEFSQPSSNHNGGNLVFGPDGYLYISSGDGGGSGDPNNNAQNINSYLGKILRIDVNNPAEGMNYGIPTNNPFVGNSNAKQEIYAYGLRNPWRFSIDSTDNTIWIADLGQADVEEINKISLDSTGVNFGWRCYEGIIPFNTQDCPSESEIEFPFAEYSHTNGNCSITGGFVYRGTEWLDFEDFYFFADYCSGDIGVVSASGNIIIQGRFEGNWVSFGEDVNKELYIIDLGGIIYKIVQFPIGTEDFKMNEWLKILPIPATDEITFSLKNDKIQSIQFFDLKGRLVYSDLTIFSNMKTVSLDHLNSGIYFAKITSEKGATLIKKIIVQ